MPAATLITDDGQHLGSLVEARPAVQSASVWQTRVCVYSTVVLGGHASTDEVQKTPGEPRWNGVWKQQALPLHSWGPEQGR